MASTVANPTVSDTYDKVLDNTAQFLRLLREAGLTDQARQRVIDDPNFRSELVRFWNGNPAEGGTTTPEIASQIMGDNFHGIDALERHLGVKLSAKSKKLFLTVPFSAEVLQACRETHMLVACGPLSLLDVRQAQTGLFYAKSEPWYGQPSEQFARSKVKAGWQLVRKNPVPDSTSKTWDEQNALLAAVEQVPSASVLAQAILIHYLETEERLFEQIYVRVSDVGSDGSRVYLGYFDEDGLHVYRYWGDRRGGNVGLSSSRKFS